MIDVLGTAVVDEGDEVFNADGEWVIGIMVGELVGFAVGNKDVGLFVVHKDVGLLEVDGVIQHNVCWNVL